MEAVRTSETSVKSNSKLHTHRRENLKSHKQFFAISGIFCALLLFGVICLECK
jgi:hypothetical protein